jgi:zeta-carotene desaturase
VEDGVGRSTVTEWLSRLGQSESLQRNFWDLLCIAAMNEDPRVAAAALFARVLRLALFTSSEDTRLGIARVGLSDCYTQAATAYIEARGGRVECGRNVTGLLIAAGGKGGPCPSEGAQSAPLPELGVCEGVRLAGGEEIKAATVVTAVPWYQLASLLPGDLLRGERFFAGVVALRPAPIISINLWFDRPVTDLDFVGLRGTTIQWLFNKGQILGSGENYVSLVLSGAHKYIGRSKEELREISLRELEEVMPAVQKAKLLHSLVIKERFATFSPTWDAEQTRLPAHTPVRGLYLAGDWTATGLPATIEGAVQSGHSAAAAVLNGA